MTNEYLVPHSSAKFTHNKRESYMVGALARFNNNFDQLHPTAKDAAAKLGMKPKVTNPYLNTAAQVVEIVHCTEDAIAVIDKLLELGVSPEPLAPVQRMPGEGVGVCEVPRGMLIHQLLDRREGKTDRRQLHHPHQPEPGEPGSRYAALVPHILDKPVEAMQPGPGNAGASLRPVHFLLGACPGGCA